jgi:hypothetical protein
MRFGKSAAMALLIITGLLVLRLWLSAVDPATRRAMAVAGGVIVVALLLGIGVGIPLFELSGRRKDEAEWLQHSVTERLRSAVINLPLTVVAHVPGSRRSHRHRDCGSVPTAEIRDTVPSGDRRGRGSRARQAGARPSATVLRVQHPREDLAGKCNRIERLREEAVESRGLNRSAIVFRHRAAEREDQDSLTLLPPDLTQDPSPAVWTSRQMQVRHHGVGHDARHDVERHVGGRGQEHRGASLVEGIAEHRARVVIVVDDQNYGARRDHKRAAYR